MQNEQTLVAVHTHTHTHTHTLCLQDYSLKTIANFACTNNQKKLKYKAKPIDIKLMHRKTVY